MLTHAYDAYGNDVLTQDDAGVAVHSGYDARNQLASRTWEGLPGGVSAGASFQYDERGLLAAIERFGDSAQTHQVGSTVFDYDTLGRTAEILHRDPLDQVLAKYDYTWDAASQLTTWTHHGETTTYAHDATGQLTSADGALPEGYAYDAAGNRSGGGQTIGAGNQLLADVQFDFAYDGKGLLALGPCGVAGCRF